MSFNKRLKIFVLLFVALLDENSLSRFNQPDEKQREYVIIFSSSDIKFSFRFVFST